MADMLRRLGYDVHLLEDLNRRELADALDVFIAGVDADAEVLVYYVGHAVAHDGINYLLPVNMLKLTPFEERLLRADSVAFSELLREIRARTNQPILAFLDASRENPFTRPVSGVLGSPEGLAAVDAPENSLVISAAGEGERAPPEADGSQGRFAEMLLGALGRDGLRAGALLQEMRAAIAATAAGVADERMPTSYGDLAEDYYFRPETAPRPTASELALARNVAGQTGEDAEEPGAKPAEPEDAGDDELARLPSASETAVPEPEPEPGPSREVITAIQKVLAQAGCYTAGIDGVWGRGSRNAVRDFARHSGIRLASTDASADLLSKIRPVTGRICPLNCGRGFEAKGGRCVAVAAPATEPDAPSRDAPARTEQAVLAPKTTPEPKRGSHGAVCILNSGVVAAVTGRASAAEAASAARSKGGSCAYVMEISGSLCFAIAKARAPQNGFPLFKAATRSGEGSARAMAQQLCEQPGQQCVVSYSVCANG